MLPTWYPKQGLCNTRASVRLSHRQTTAMAAGGFAAERPVDRRYRSMTAVTRENRVLRACRPSAAKAGLYNHIQTANSTEVFSYNNDFNVS